MKILISGATGFLGQSLSKYFQTKGHTVIQLVRSKEFSTDDIFWSPNKHQVDLAQLENFDVIINLSGENIAKGRWTKEKKDRILKSRIDATTFLAEAIDSLKHPPKLFLSASAIGYYGTKTTSEVTEASPKGEGFLASIVEEWEKAANQVKSARVVNLRFGMILSPSGGALKKMLLPFKMGLGGPLGSGDQFISWIALEDLCCLLEFIIQNKSIEGPCNITSPNPVTNKEFTTILGNELSRPTICHLPSSVLGLMYGEMAEELFLSSMQAKPKKLLEANAPFKHQDLATYLSKILDDS